MDFHAQVTEISLDFMPCLCLTGLSSTKHDVTWHDFFDELSRLGWMQQSDLFERIALLLFGGHCYFGRTVKGLCDLHVACPGARRFCWLLRCA